MKERVTVTPKLLELNDSNDIYMTLMTRILSAEPNSNKAEFTQDFILNTVNNKEKYVGIPFVVDKESLENGKHSNLGHKLSPDGELMTDQIGSFVDFWVDKDENDVMFLGGTIRIMKRFSKTCEAVKELYSSGELATSCEVLVQDYEEISDSGIRKIHYNEGKNQLFASAIVANPADDKARPTLLVAEAYAEDMKAGGDKVAKKTKDKIETFNKGIDIKYHGTFEFSGLRIHELEEKIFSLLNPVDTENGGRHYNFWIRELYTDSVILEDDNDWQTLYKAKYTVDNDTVTLANQEDWIQGTYGFIPQGVNVSELMEQNDEKIKELNQELSTLKEEKIAMAEDNQKKIEELEAKIEELKEEIKKLEGEGEEKDTENAELQKTIVSQKEEMVKAEEMAAELNSKIEELTPYKEQVEKAEKEAEIAALTDKFSKLLDEETLKSEEVAEAIQNLDEAKLNSIVVAEVAKKATETASKQASQVVVTASKQDGLPKVKDSKYWASSN